MNRKKQAIKQDTNHMHDAVAGNQIYTVYTINLGFYLFRLPFKMCIFDSALVVRKVNIRCF